MYIYFEREREKYEWGKGREKGRQRIPSRLRAVSTEPNAGLNLMNREIMTWAEIKSQMPNWLSHQGAPM